MMTPLVTAPIGGFSTKNPMPYFQLPTRNPPLGFSNFGGGTCMGSNGNPPHGTRRPPREGNRPLGGGGGSLGRSGPSNGGGPPSGKRPPRGGGSRFPIGGIGVPFGAPWWGSPWNSWYPPWYPPPTPTTLMVLSSRNSLLYPIYFVGTNLDAHVRVFRKQFKLMVKSEMLT
jgi:hypothetical protein